LDRLLKGDIKILPIVSNTGNTERINFNTHAAMPTFQLSRNTDKMNNHSNHPIIPTHEGNICSLGGNMPFLLPCIIRVSNTVMAENR
jgi:hypothetical protein